MMILGSGRRILAGFPIVHSFSLQIIFMALVWSFFCIVFYQQLMLTCTVHSVSLISFLCGGVVSGGDVLDQL